MSKLVESLAARREVRTREILDQVQAEDFVTEFFRLRQEGWEVDLAEFLERLPEPLREPVYRGIDLRMANEPPPPPREELAEHPEFAAEPQLDSTPLPPPPTAVWTTGDSLVAGCARVVPQAVRDAYLAEVIHGRQDLRELGLSRFERSLFSVERLAHGLAQHAPLVEGDGWAADARWVPVAQVGWAAAGPLLLIGGLLGVGAITLLGGIALLAALAGVTTLVLRREDTVGAREAALVNGVAGGLLVVLVACAVAGLPLALIVGLAVATGSTAIASLAIKALLVLTLGVCAAVSLSGFAPTPWAPRRRA